MPFILAIKSINYANTYTSILFNVLCIGYTLKKNRTFLKVYLSLLASKTVKTSPL